MLLLIKPIHYAVIEIVVIGRFSIDHAAIIIIASHLYIELKDISDYIIHIERKN